MDLLNSLMGGGGRDQAQDFVNRYDRGAPHDGIDGHEAFQQYQRVAPHLSQQDYEMSAEEAFSRMDPRERQQFAQMLSQQARQQGTRIQDLDGDGVDDRMQQDPRYLAQTMGRMQQQQPGLLQQLMGGGGGAMGGAMGGGAGNMLQNPLAKAALGGIAAMAMRRMMSGGGNQGGGNPFGGGGGIRM
jgi:hypothetical protein